VRLPSGVEAIFWNFNLCETARGSRGDLYLKIWNCFRYQSTFAKFESV